MTVCFRIGEQTGKSPGAMIRFVLTAMRPPIFGIFLLLTMLVTLGVAQAQRPQRVAVNHGVRDIFSLPKGRVPKTTVITGVSVIDGKGGVPLKDATIVLSDGKIRAVGPRQTVTIPQDADVVEGEGLTLLPGLIDAHFHLDGDNELPRLFLTHGVTSVRDPGAWMEAYEQVIKQDGLKPRLFLAGPHLDCPPPAYPKDSLIVRDTAEGRLAVTRLIDRGATVIKVYFRLPLALIETVTETAHARGIPVTAHLEIVEAEDAIRAGIDGLEHVTSVGTALLPPREAEVYRQSILADNEARREGRYRVWSEIDLNSPRVEALVDLMKQRNTTLSPTLAVFERRSGDRDVTDMHVRAFRQMMRFVGLANRAGVRLVVGSHSSVPHADRGWAYQREMELLVESGLTPIQAIQAATIENARFFRVDDRIGSLEVGKQADLLLVEGDPSQDVSAMRRVRRVMVSGVWVE
jgi:imidazolonepropionase-like amidohydrolase